MTKSSVATAILVAVVVSVLVASGLVAAQQDQTTNSNTNQNTNSGSTSGQNMNGSTLDSSDRKFIMEAAMAGMEEVELGRLAAQRGSTDAIKQFGQRMVDDHTKANDELKQIASTKGVTLPSALDNKHQADVAKISALSGAEFDRAYLKEAGVKDHSKAEKLFQKEADKGKDPDLKAFAAKTLPIIQEHLRMAQGMSGGMGKSGNMNASGGNSNMSGNMNTSGNMNMSGNSNMSGNMNSNTSENSNMSQNSNTANSNTTDNTNTSGNSNMAGNDNTSGNMNASNANGNSNTSNANGNGNTSNANGNSNTPRRRR